MYQKITIVGNLGRDPEMRFMADGTAVTSFSIAVSDGWGERKKTMWFRVSVWGKRAETANQYLSKGKKILVEGRLTSDANGSPRVWTRQDGTVSASFEIRADNFVFMGGRADDMAASGEATSSSAAGAVEEDEIPF